MPIDADTHTLVMPTPHQKNLLRYLMASSSS